MTFLKEGRGIFSPWATGGRAGRRKTCTLCHVNNDFLVQEDIGSVGMGGRNGEEV